MQKEERTRRALDKINALAVLLFLVAGCALDSVSLVPAVLVVASLIWFAVAGRKGSIKKWLI